MRSSFEADDAPKALIVYVGQREAYVVPLPSDRYGILTTNTDSHTSSWKGRADNPYRGTPWNVNSVPTIIKKEVRHFHSSGLVLSKFIPFC